MNALQLPETFFAPASRTSKAELSSKLEQVNNSPVMSGLLQVIGGLLAILDENRQIVTVNNTLLKKLEIDDPRQLFGLRPGEALHCSHAHEAPHGCGTTRFCSNCGAAIAMVSSLETNEPAERVCVLETNRHGKKEDIVLIVRSQPITLEGTRFLLLFLQDITAQHQKASLERTFFHDVNNMLAGLVGASEMLALDSSSPLAQIVHQTTLRLRDEIAIQRCLSQSRSYDPSWRICTTTKIMEELRSFFSRHPVAKGKFLEFPSTYTETTLITDISLLQRVLCNMVTNALEATDPGGTIKLWVEDNDNSVTFCVWNNRVIPPDIAGRIFQRNFSTKEQSGRGLGTYSMKFFGEQILKGKVSFTSTVEAGTTFRCTLSK